jgi:hypothetical protein
VRIALILNTAFVSTKPDDPAHECRLRQYLNGLEQVAEVSAQYPVFDVYSVDNTVEDPADLNVQIVDAFHRIRGFQRSVHFFDNEIEHGNTGVGTMRQWIRMAPELVDRYEFVVHYEPRQHLVNFSFFERMVNQPDTYFCMYRDRVKLYGFPLTLPRFWTGLFAMKTRDFLGYVRAPDRRMPPPLKPHPWWWAHYRRFRWRYLPGWAVWVDECVEVDLLRFVRRHRIPFVRVSDLGTLWHQKSKDRMVKMIDCDFQDGEMVPGTFQEKGGH